MLRHWVVPENHGQLFTVILLQIAQRRPKDEARHAFEVAKFFQCHPSFRIAANMRRLRACFVRNGNLKARLPFPSLKKENAGNHCDDENRKNDPDSESAVRFFHRRHETRNVDAVAAYFQREGTGLPEQTVTKYSSTRSAAARQKTKTVLRPERWDWNRSGRNLRSRTVRPDHRFT